MSDNAVDNIYIEFTTNADEAVSGIDRLRGTLGRLKKATQGGSSGANDVNTRLTSMRSSATRLHSRLSKLTDVAASWFKKSNEYVEALNLFNVAMGTGADKAMQYAEKVQNLMGIDIKDWMEYQGGFYQLSAGYGIASEQAENMSKNLTQLAYDLSSLWNTDTATAFQKLQSGMSGQIKGLKQWGINLSVAALRETALAHGITLSTSKMTEAQKATLRYITIMEHTQNAQGDLARTLTTPENALRILNAQFELLKRSLGNVVSVIAVKAIPYVQALAKVATMAANALANLLGFKMPEIDYSTVPDTGITDLGNDAEDTTDKLKKLKKNALGFDELNILSPQESTGGNSYDPTFGMDLGKYDYEDRFLNGADTSRVDEIVKEWMGALEPLLPALEGFSLVFKGFWDALTWTGKTFILPILRGIGEWLKEHPTAAKVIGEIAAAIFILNTALKAVKWVRELTVVQKLTEWFSKLRDKTGQVTSAFNKKNTSLEKQTAKTYQEVYSLSALVGAFAAAAAAARALGGDILKIPDKLPNLNPSPAYGAIPAMSFGLVPAIQAEFAAANAWLSSQVLTVPALDVSGLDILSRIMSGFSLAKTWLASQVWALPTIAAVDLGILAAVTASFSAANAWLMAQSWSLPFVSTADMGILSAISSAFNSAKSWLSSQSWSLPALTMPDISSVFDTVRTSVSSFAEYVTTSFASVASGLSDSASAWMKWSLIVAGAVALVTAAVAALNVETGGAGALLGGAVSAAAAGASAFASGGFPSTGELFIAREAGPEMVGSIGKRTAVANNNQIVSAVSAGVAKAVSSVVGTPRTTQSSGGTFKIKGSDLVYVADKANKARGANISNNFKFGGR